MRYKTKNQNPSNSEFGWTFTAVIFILSIYAFFNDIKYLGFLLFCISFLIGFLTIIIPAVLAPLNGAWFALGLFLGKVVSPIILSIIFFILIVPIAILTRLFGRDALSLKNSHVSSYWINKELIDPESFKNQF